MPPVLLFFLLLAIVAAIIHTLHRSQQRRRLDNIDRSTPLPALDTPPLAELPRLPAAALPENWLDQVKQLRELGQLEAALQLSHAHYPRLQAFQQSALILRQQLRDAGERGEDCTEGLEALYQIAVLADLFRSSNPHKPADPAALLPALLEMRFDYMTIGHQHLKLLNKGDASALEYAWGRPAGHCHAEASPACQVLLAPR